MDMDLGTLCLLGIFLIVGFMLFSRMFGGGGRAGTDYSERGDERRTVDNPEVESRGAFGADPASSQSSQSRGLNRSNRSGGIGSLFRGSNRTSGGRANNPEVKSRGSFGRGKK